MYGSTNRSLPQRFLILILECLFLSFVYWFLFMNGSAFFHLPQGNFDRKVLLLVFCLITFVRMTYMIFFLLRRGITWGEALNVPFAFALYYIGFSMLGGIRDIPVDGVDGLAIALFVAGSAMNTVSEVLRNAWRKKKSHQGRLYTEGLFKYAVHINYFGDVIWVAGFALLTRNLWSGILPLGLLCMFVFYNIPLHDKYMREKYGEAFIAYEKRTKKLVPFIY